MSSSSAGNVHVAHDPGPANVTQADKQGKRCFRKLALAARSRNEATEQEQKKTCEARHTLA